METQARKTLQRYKLGLALLVLFTIGLLVVMLVQASATKQDSQTYAAATAAADKLNNYTTDKQVMPSSLAAAGVSQPPATISYTTSGDSYRFCVTYKTASSGFDPASLATDVALGSYANSNASPNDDGTSSNQSYLTVSETHHKGQNCQTIKPLLANSYSDTIDQDTPKDLTRTSDSNAALYNDSLIGIQSKSRDSKRKTDISALQAQIEAAYATSGYYPTLANLNDSSWRSMNMKGLDPAALRDPQGNTSTIVATPTKNQYSYAATGDDGKACDNTANDCTHYVLSAQLEDGTTYSKQDLNY